MAHEQRFLDVCFAGFYCLLVVVPGVSPDQHLTKEKRPELRAELPKISVYVAVMLVSLRTVVLQLRFFHWMLQSRVQHVRLHDFAV